MRLNDRSKSSWNCDLSDLGSIDSNIFKNSLHQSVLDNGNKKIKSQAEIHCEDNSCSEITVIKIEDNHNRDDPEPSIISYNSIYLSSESDQQTVINENEENLDTKILQFEQIIDNLNKNIDFDDTDVIIDDIYQQVNNRGVKKTQKFNELRNEINLQKNLKIDEQKRSKVEIKYSSLPDSEISKLLSDFELIDEKLRNDSIEPEPDYETLYKKKIDEEDENPKGAPSIEVVQLSTKELGDSNQSTLLKSSNFNLVTVSGKKVIVDELDAKNDTEDKNFVDNQKENSDKITIKICENEEELTCANNKKLSEVNRTNDLLHSRKSRPTKKSSSFNMPRPQLLNIVDSKRSELKLQKSRSSEFCETELNKNEIEFLTKVDSIRNYWSKILQDDNDDEVSYYINETSKSSNDIPDALKNEDFQSFYPGVEIVELDGDGKNDVEFDHVRYKVLKSDIFKKNLLITNPKEQNFDGLMQYLQDYSFQELLRSNNVVIIEPVRTKFERVADKTESSLSNSCKITNGAANKAKSGEKKFYYQPIRVNKELYEEELPVPDTVRNVRKMFEESLRKKELTKVNSNKTSVTEWDSMSLSSGVSSAADLNSPCECNENSKNDSSCSYSDKNYECSSSEAKSYFNGKCNCLRKNVSKINDKVSRLKVKGDTSGKAENLSLKIQLIFISL